MCDAKDAMQLADLTANLDAYISQCKEEKRRITDLDAEVGHQTCADPESFSEATIYYHYYYFLFIIYLFFLGGMVFLVNEGDPNTTKSGPSSARKRTAISMAFRWRADDGPTLNAGLVAL